MRPETRLQRDLRTYLGMQGLRTVAVPNGAVLRGTARQRAMQVSSLKLDGLCPGFPDLIVYGPEGRVGHIEVKVEGRYQTPEQKHVQQWLASWGHLYAVCRSIADVDETLERWGWRARAAA